MLLERVKFAVWWAVVALLCWSIFNAYVFTQMAIFVDQPESIVHEYWRNFIVSVLFLPVLASLVLWNARRRKVSFWKGN